MVRLIGHKLAPRGIHKSRQLGEVHGIEVEKVSASAKAGHWGEHDVNLPGRHDAMIQCEQATRKEESPRTSNHPDEHEASGPQCDRQIHVTAFLGRSTASGIRPTALGGVGS